MRKLTIRGNMNERIVSSRYDEGRILNQYNAALLLYGILLSVLMLFHEPWFDEAQAWLISRDASIGDILFLRPHYEGHPPLWHLLLALPAKLGCPYEPSLKVTQFVFAAAVVWVILFLSPFPRPLRLGLPFTYFFLYQYGAIARPYAMLGLALFLTAHFWKRRNEKPWPIVLSLAFLCLTSAYGIVLAGGIASAWVLEAVFSEKAAFPANRKRLAAWSFLLLLAMLLIAEIWPAPDTYAIAVRALTQKPPVILQLFNFFIVLPAETFYTSFSGYAYLYEQSFAPAELLSASLISLGLWSFLILLGKRRKQLHMLFIPSAFFGIFASLFYFYTHHYGLVLMFFLFYLWICLEELPLQPDALASFTAALRGKYPAAAKILRYAFSFFILSVILINAFWSVGAFCRELAYQYASGGSLAAFVREHHLEDYRWFGAWRSFRAKDDADIILAEDTDYTMELSLTANPYFSKALVFNTDQSYLTHIMPSAEESERCIQAWSNAPEPDMILSSQFDFGHISDRLKLRSIYYPIKICDVGLIWKADPFSPNSFNIYVRSDLYKKLRNTIEQK